MANADRANGFSFAKSLTGHAPNAMARKYPVTVNAERTALTDGAIYLGDAVQFGTTTGAGTILPFTSGQQCAGVVVGVGTNDGIEMGEAGPFDAENLEKRFLSETEAGFVWIIPAKDNLFEVQASDIPANPAYTDLAGVSPDASATHGSTTTSRSTMEITFGAGSDVKVVEYDTVANDITLVDGKYVVMFQNVEMSQA